MLSNSESKKAALTLAGSILGLWLANAVFKGKKETLLVLMGGGVGAIVGHEVYKEKMKRIKK